VVSTGLEHNKFNAFITYLSFIFVLSVDCEPPYNMFYALSLFVPPMLNKMTTKTSTLPISFISLKCCSFPPFPSPKITIVLILRKQKIEGKKSRNSSVPRYCPR
jgi:hypothetical protein